MQVYSFYQLPVLWSSIPFNSSSCWCLVPSFSSLTSESNRFFTSSSLDFKPFILLTHAWWMDQHNMHILYTRIYFAQVLFLPQNRPIALMEPNLNNNTLENLSLVLMFPDKGFLPSMQGLGFLKYCYSNLVPLMQSVYGPQYRRHSGLMVSSLDSGSSNPGSSPGRGHCVEFLGKILTLTFPLSSLHPGINGYWRIVRATSAHKNAGSYMWWTSIPSRGVKILLVTLAFFKTKVW